MLLAVGTTEYDVANDEDDNAENVVPKRVLTWVEVDIPALDAIEVGYPHVVTPQQHPAKALLENVPSSYNEVLKNKVVEDVKEVEAADNEHGHIDIAELVVLLGGNREIHKHPPLEARATLREELDVKA